MTLNGSFQAFYPVKQIIMFVSVSKKKKKKIKNPKTFKTLWGRFTFYPDDMGT